MRSSKAAGATPGEADVVDPSIPGDDDSPDAPVVPDDDDPATRVIPCDADDPADAAVIQDEFDSAILDTVAPMCDGDPVIPAPGAPMITGDAIPWSG